MWPFKKTVWTQVILDKMLKDLDNYGWTQGAYARNYDGDTVDELSSEAIAFCTLGLLRKAAVESGPKAERVTREAELLVARAVVNMGYEDGTITSYNDKVAKNKEDIRLLIKEAKTIETSV